MNIRPEEVSSIIKKEIDNYKKSLEIKTSGTDLEVGDGIARIYGLSNVMSGELLEFPHGVMGMALNLDDAEMVVLVSRQTALPVAAFQYALCQCYRGGYPVAAHLLHGVLRVLLCISLILAHGLSS